MKIFDNATLSRSSLTVIGSSGSGILAVVMWIEDILEYNDDDGDDDSDDDGGISSLSAKATVAITLTYSSSSPSSLLSPPRDDVPWPSPLSI